MIHLSQEIWDGVVRDLPSFCARTAAQIFKFKLGNRLQDNHSRVWDALFQDQTWALTAREAGLNPTLIGSNLFGHYKYRRAATASYMCLCSGPDTQAMRRAFLYSRQNFELFLKCLKPHSFNQTTYEIKFKCGITLNVSEILGYPCVIVAPTKVISYRSRGFRSGYLLWEDDTNGLRQLDSHNGHDDIVGNSESPATRISDVQEMCTLHLHPNDRTWWRVELIDPEEYKRQVADAKAHRDELGDGQFT